MLMCDNTTAQQDESLCSLEPRGANVRATYCLRQELRESKLKEYEAVLCSAESKLKEYEAVLCSAVSKQA